nr:MAG TPA: hypothetical protein [Caudoviricetes sp.]
MTGGADSIAFRCSTIPERLENRLCGKTKSEGENKDEEIYRI